MREKTALKHQTQPKPDSPGARLRAALKAECPLQVVGVIHAYAAILAQKIGFRALYLSGAGVANASRGLPDVGITTLTDVLTDVRRIASATCLPLLVDVDTGWDDPHQTVQQMIAVGVAGIHIEDQVPAKRCGHLPDKQLVSAVPDVQRAADRWHQTRMRTLRWLTAAAVLAIVAGIPAYKKSIDREREIQAARESELDAQLLDRVNTHLSRTAPAPLQPLMEMQKEGDHR